MTEEKSLSTQPQGTSHAQQPPGGGSSRGPDFGTGGEPQVPVPPYDDERAEADAAGGAEGVRKAFDAGNAPEPGPRVPLSDEERRGVTGTELDPEPALGVGKSRRTGAEEQAPRSDAPTKGPAERPVGKVAGDENADEPGPAGPK